jgi:hypothetical protein
MTSPSFERTATIVLVAAALALLAACKPGDQGSGNAARQAGGSTAGGLTAAGSSRSVSDTVVGGGVVEVTLKDGDALVEGAAVEVHGDMTHAGMAPVIAAALEVEPGLYRTEVFGFTMAGDWIITAQAKAQDGRTAKAEAFVTVSR